MRPAILVTVGFVLGGCSSLAYYGQAINGGLEMLSKRRPLPAVIADPATPDEVRRKLEWVIEARKYAIGKLDLPASGSYRSYVELDHTYPVWVVYVVPEFSLVPKEWCYLFVGCVPYRGYFDRKSAQAFAEKFMAKGFDVALNGVPAYSTLGWFDDPINSSMLRWGKAALIGMVFHEMAHEKLYVTGAAAFNESFADTIENVGLERYLGPRDPDALIERRNWQQANKAMDPYLREARASLMVIYRSSADPARKRKLKRAEFAWLVARYHEVGKRYGIEWSEVWLDSLNNATLARTNTYDRWMPAFRHLLACVHEDLPAFYKAAARIGHLDAALRVKRLRELKAAELKGSRTCPAWLSSGAVP